MKNRTTPDERHKKHISDETQLKISRPPLKDEMLASLCIGINLSLRRLEMRGPNTERTMGAYSGYREERAGAQSSV